MNVDTRDRYGAMGEKRGSRQTFGWLVGFLIVLAVVFWSLSRMGNFNQPSASLPGQPAYTTGDFENTPAVRDGEPNPTAPAH